MRKAVIYARVSTKDQEREGYSIPAQLKSLREYAKRHLVEVAQEFLEAESAGKAGRKQFQAMVRLIESDPGVSAILVEKTDRLYRNYKDVVLLDDLGIDLHFVKDGRVIGRNSKSTERFAHDIEVAQARFYLNNLSEEVKKGQRQKALQGQFPGGRVPLGYVRNRVNKAIEMDPARSQIIRHLFESYATGEVSLTELYEESKRMGLTYRTSGRPLARSGVERMLKDPFYTGKFRWSGIVYRGDHPAIVDSVLFERVQESFLGRTNCRASGNRQFTYMKLIKCGECGRAVTAEIKKGKYLYYHCTGYGGDHKVTYVPEQILDSQFAEIVGRASLPLDFYDYLRECLETELGNRKLQIARDRERLELERDKTEINMKKAFQASLDGHVSTEFFQSVYNDHQSQLDALNHRLDNLSESFAENIDTAMKIIELSHQAGSHYLRANPDQKRRLLKSVLSNCLLRATTLYPIYRKPFDLFAEGIKSNNKRRE